LIVADLEETNNEVECMKGVNAQFTLLVTKFGNCMDATTAVEMKDDE